MYGSCDSAGEYELEEDEDDDGGDDNYMPDHGPDGDGNDYDYAYGGGKCDPHG